MRFLLVTLLICFSGYSQIKVISWNLQNLGNSKSDSIVEFMAKTVMDADIIALQEIIATPGGSKTLARLVAKLNRTGAKWEYRISNPTSGAGSERYAYVWKPSKVKLKGQPFLDKKFEKEIGREPYIATFTTGKSDFTLFSFHAVPKKKQPEKEIAFFKYYPELYKLPNMIFLGDFNCSESSSVFIPLKKMGWKPVLVNQRTTLKMKCVGSRCLASEYDNIFIPSNIKFTGGTIKFHNLFTSPKAARRISDHLPIYMMLFLN